MGGRLSSFLACEVVGKSTAGMEQISLLKRQMEPRSLQLRRKLMVIVSSQRGENPLLLLPHVHEVTDYSVPGSRSK